MASNTVPKSRISAFCAFIGLVLVPTAWLTIIVGGDVFAADGNGSKAEAGVNVASEAGVRLQPAVDIERLISQLSAADFRLREDATRQLLTAGPDVIRPIAKAAQTDDVETVYRAVRILQSFSDRDEAEVQRQAVTALESLSSAEKKSTADLAADALAFYHLSLQDRAIEQLKRLRAAVRPVYDSDTVPNAALDPAGIEVVLDSRWAGKSDDLELLKKIPNLQWLHVVGVSLDQSALHTISELPRLVQLDLFGTDVALENKQQLTQKLVGVTIDYRKGAKLGVGGNASLPGCLIGVVAPDTAASEADVQPGDEVTKFDGQTIQNFEELTTLIAAKKGGEQIQLEIRRNDETLVKDITLGKWR
jgi:hypothetical protein